MINITNKTNCCGCHACYNICPQFCIRMEQDLEGFKYPIVDKSKCIECNLCEKVCPIINNINEPSINMPPLAFAAFNKNEKIRSESSSGGLLSIIAEHVLAQGGLIYGAAFDENFNVVHQCASNSESLGKLRGSKYVESVIGDTYKHIKENLENSTLVLFSGTPCQVHGLKTYLIKDYDNLICTDLICHGVPSPLIWNKYLNYREKTNDSKTRYVNFRAKITGWKNFSFYMKFENDSEYTATFHKDIFMRGFLTDLYLRPSCYECKFKIKNRISDFTLADFWGIEQLAYEIDDDKGISLVMIHSLKAKKLLEKFKDKIVTKQMDFFQSINCNSMMVQSANFNKNRNSFFKGLHKTKQNIALYIEHSLIKSRSKRFKFYIKNLYINLFK